jgi:hypothetical protein
MGHLFVFLFLSIFLFARSVVSESYDHKLLENEGFHSGGQNQENDGSHSTSDNPSLVSGACACPILKAPKPKEKALSARWMMHTLNWGVLSTISTRLEGSPPFGNPISFVDGHCDHSTGIPYFYGSDMDQSFIDVKENDKVSLTLSEAQVPSVCGAETMKGCDITTFGDPENPMCARLVVTGKLVRLEEEADEYIHAKKALFERHKVMKTWPADHGWVVAKIEIEDIWLIDFFGGASVLKVEDYLATDLSGLEQMESTPSLKVVMNGVSGRHGEGYANLFLSMALFLSLIALVLQTKKASGHSEYNKLPQAHIAALKTEMD